jgi:hypothetical protein
MSSVSQVLRAREPFLLRLHSKTKPTMARMIKRAVAASMAGRYLECLSIVVTTSVDNITVVDLQPSSEVILLCGVPSRTSWNSTRVDQRQHFDVRVAHIFPDESKSPKSYKGTQNVVANQPIAREAIVWQCVPGLCGNLQLKHTNCEAA